MAYKILIVDDESSNLHVMRTILQDSYTLIFAKTGERAIELTFNQRPDLILLDIMMPQMNGYEVCRILKNDANVSHIPIVFVSALDEYKNELEGLKIGAVDFLIKPVSSDLVKNRIAHILSDIRVTTMRENYQLVVDKIALLVAHRREEKEVCTPRIAAVCEWLSLKYGLATVKSEDLRLAYPLCQLGELWDDGTHLSTENKTLSLFAEATTGFVSLIKTLLTYKNVHWDGSGDPSLSEEMIPKECNVVATIEKLDAAIVTQNGDIKTRVEHAITQISCYSGTLLDPHLILLLNEYSDELCQLYQMLLTKSERTFSSQPLVCTQSA